eukprot:10191790-Lingulodinium_polyedra.AAC.1
MPGSPPPPCACTPGVRSTARAMGGQARRRPAPPRRGRGRVSWASGKARPAEAQVGLTCRQAAAARAGPCTGPTCGGAPKGAS